MENPNAYLQELLGFFLFIYFFLMHRIILGIDLKPRGPSVHCHSDLSALNPDIYCSIKMQNIANSSI